jgi:hypothetical protein
MLMRPSTAAATVYPTLEALRAAVRGCRACEAHLPLGPRPVLRAGETARIPVVGQEDRTVIGLLALIPGVLALARRMERPAKAV